MEKDITGRAVEESAKIVAAVIKRVQEKVPLGPSQVNLTPEEAKAEVTKLRGAPLIQMMELLGREETISALRNRDA